MADVEGILADWYLGELGGEALFWGLAEHSTPEYARKWLALAEVESRVGRRLAETLLLRDQSLPSGDDVPAQARARVDEERGRSWTEQMRWLHRIASEALDEMRIDAAQLPTELNTLREYVLAHEQVLIEFSRLEMQGRGDESLRPVEAFLTMPDRAYA